MRAVLSTSLMLLLALLLWRGLGSGNQPPGATAEGRDRAVSVLVGSRGHLLPRARMEGSLASFEDAICVGDLLLKPDQRQPGLCVALLGPGMSLNHFEVYPLAQDPEASERLLADVRALPPGSLCVASIIGDARPPSSQLASVEKLFAELGARTRPLGAERASWALIAGRLDEAWIPLAEAYSEARAVNLSFTFDRDLSSYRALVPALFRARADPETSLSLFHSHSSASDLHARNLASTRGFKEGQGRATFFLRCNASPAAERSSRLHWENLGLGAEPVFETFLSSAGLGAGPMQQRLLVNGRLVAELALPADAGKAWHPWRVDLKAFAGQTVSLTLESEMTKPSGQATALWGDAQLHWKRPQ